MSKTRLTVDILTAVAHLSLCISLHFLVAPERVDWHLGGQVWSFVEMCASVHRQHDDDVFICSGSGMQEKNGDCIIRMWYKGYKDEYSNI